MRQWAQETKLADGRRVIDQEWVQVNLARVHAKLEFLRLMNWKVAWAGRRRASSTSADASTIKVFGTEFYMEALPAADGGRSGQRAYLKRGLARARCCASRLESMHRGTIILTFGGGTNEMQRDLISQFTLGLPRADR